MLFKVGVEISSYSFTVFILAEVNLKLNTLKSIYENLVIF